MQEHAKFRAMKDHFKKLKAKKDKRKLTTLERCLQELVNDTSRLMQTLGTLEARIRDENLYAHEAAKNVTVYSLRGVRPAAQVQLPSQYVDILLASDFQTSCKEN